MKCQKCDKVATFHITDIIDGVPKEVHLCDKHAAEYLHRNPEPRMPGAEELGLDDDPADSNLKGLTDELERSDDDFCECCQRSFLDFRKTGLLGCEHDYQVFRDRLVPLFRSIHGADKHEGKRPRRVASNNVGARLVRLRNELQDAVNIEDYETASKLRDQIAELSKQTV